MSADTYYLGPDLTFNEQRCWGGLLSNPPQVVAIDIETVDIKDQTILGIGCATSSTESWYFPINAPEGPSSLLGEFMLRVLANPNITKVYHNGLFDLAGMWGMPCDLENIADTMIMAKLHGLHNDLQQLTSLFGRQIQSIKDILPKKSGNKKAKMTELPTETIALKCLNDVQATYLCYERMLPELDKKYFAREMALYPILLKMSKRGLKIDHTIRAELETEIAAQVDYYRALAEAEGFNPGSPQQVGMVLAMRNNILPIKKGGKSYDTSEEVLRRLDDPIAALVLNHREFAYQLSHYITPLAGCERGYTRFHLNAATGRISSTERNMQNIPVGKMRNMYLPDSGTFTSADYSQQELRTLAYFSGDPGMLEIYEKGLDLHQETADFMGIERKIAKNVGFAMLYGATPETIMETANIKDKSRAERLQAMWFAKFPVAGAWISQRQMQGLEDRYVRTIQGRRLWLPQPWEEKDSDVVRKAVNYSIQGSAAELTKDAMLRVKHLDLALTIHDEIIIDGRVEAEELRELGLEEVGPFHTPIDVEFMDRWN
jgi:DNA polymerase-1